MRAPPAWPRRRGCQGGAFLRRGTTFLREGVVEGGRGARGTTGTGAHENDREIERQKVEVFFFLPPKCEKNFIFSCSLPLLLASFFLGAGKKEKNPWHRARASRPPPLLQQSQLQQSRLQRLLPPLQQQQQAFQQVQTAGLRGTEATAEHPRWRRQRLRRREPMAPVAPLLPMLLRPPRLQSPSRPLSAVSAGTSTTRAFASVSVFLGSVFETRRKGKKEPSMFFFRAPLLVRFPPSSPRPL